MESRAVEALKTIVTFGAPEDFIDQEALEEISSSFHDFVNSDDPEVKSLLPNIISKIAEVLKDHESNKSNDSETNKESVNYFDLDEYVINVANKFIV